MLFLEFISQTLFTVINSEAALLSHMRRNIWYLALVIVSAVVRWQNECIQIWTEMQTCLHLIYRRTQLLMLFLMNY